ncbi:TPA: hypothetical protein ACGW3W_002175 [Pseudomonas aeruginosa]
MTTTNAAATRQLTNPVPDSYSDRYATARTNRIATALPAQRGPGVLKYSEVLDHYRRLLQANPGKALLICEGGNVAILEEGGVFGAAIRANGSVELDNPYDFDISAFDDDHGCWDGETPELAWERIQYPTFIDLTATPDEMD